MLVVKLFGLPYAYVSVPVRGNAKQNSISCFITSVMMFTLWIFIIETDPQVFFSISCQDTWYNCLGFGMCDDIQIWFAIQCERKKKKNLIKTSGCLLWCTFCCACQWGQMPRMRLCFSTGCDGTGRAGATGSQTVRTGRTFTQKTTWMKLILLKRPLRRWMDDKRLAMAACLLPSICGKVYLFIDTKWMMNFDKITP